MPGFTAPLTAEGALVDVRIGLGRAQLQALRAAGRPVPSPVSLKALIDTGAQCTCVDPQPVRGLNLAPKGPALANLPSTGGLTLGGQCDASLTVVHPSGDARLDLVVRDLLVMELTLGALGYQALIGRDVLELCRFLYDGPRGRFRLAY